MAKFDVRDDYYFQRYDKERDLNEETEKTYRKHLNKFCNAVGKSLKDIIDDCKDQQNFETEEIISSTSSDGKQIIQRKVIKFDVDGADSLIRQYFKKFEEYCKSKGNKNTTINSSFDTIKAVLSYFKVELPYFPKLPDDADNWELLSKEDFKFILADSSLMHKSLTLFMLSSGLRITDCLNKTIGDYMDATSDYHDFVEVDEFIDNAPDDMMGFWDFEPHKTQKKHTICRTFNSPESNKFILQNLRRIKNEYMPKKSKELKLTKSDALFGSKQGFYKKAPAVLSISTMFGRKNKKLYDWHISRINQDIKDGKISVEDKDKYIDLIPKFHPHACRKYFCTMIERHTSNERRYRLMEGHAPKNKLDKSYIDISKKEIAEIYEDAVGDLSVYYTDENDIKKIKEEHDKEIGSLRNQLAKERQERQEERQEHQKEIDNLKSSVGDMQKQFDDLNSIRTRSNIEKTIIDYFNANYEEDVLRQEKVLAIARKKCLVLCKLAYEIAIEEESKFRDEGAYLDSLIQRAMVKYTLNPDINQFEKETLSPEELEVLNEHVALYTEVLERIQSDDTLWNMVKNDQIKLKNIIFYVIRKNSGNIHDLTDYDKKDMVQDVLMQYLKID